MTPPLPDPASRALLALGARRRDGSPLSPKVLVATLRSLGAEDPALVAVFDARGIAGERHLLSAWAHLGRARTRGEQRLRDRNAEFALFVAGDDQLPRALAKVGVSESTTEFVVVAEKPREPKALLERFELIEDAAVYPRPPDVATLDRLGIDSADRSALPASGYEGLVLERVALLELSAAHAQRPDAKH